MFLIHNTEPDATTGLKQYWGFVELDTKADLPSRENTGDVPDTLDATTVWLSCSRSILMPNRNQPRNMHWCNLINKKIRRDLYNTCNVSQVTQNKYYLIKKTQSY